ncbi:MAG: RidA family protein [Oscillochloridaceae bacterium umkhey_bin13]
MSAELTFRNPEGLAPPSGYSHVVTVRGGTTVYVSGQVAFDAAGMLVGEGDHRRQAEQVFANLQMALAAVGARFEHVVKLTYYVVNLSPEVTQMLRELRADYLNLARPPASTMVAVAGLVDPRLLIEIEAIAVIP